MRNPVIDDRSAEEWERIKNFTGARNKVAKHPLQQEAERRQMREPQHLDEGGPVFDLAPDQNDIWGGQKPLSPAAPPPLNPIVPRGTIPQAPIPGNPVPSVPAPVSGAPSPSGMPLDAAMNDQASKIMGGITPDAIARLMQGLNESNRKAQIGAGIAGIGDAIQSVGGIHGENMKNAEDTIQKNRETAMKVPGMMAEVGKERYGLTKELGADDPKSMRSFVARQANKGLLTKMGFTEEEQAQISASLMDGIRSGAIDREKALAEIQAGKEYHEAELGIQGATLKNTAANQQTQREQEDERIKEDAAKALAGRGVTKSIVDLIPGTAGHAAAQTLKEQMGGGGESSAPHGNRVQQNGKVYQWNGSEYIEEP